MKKYFENKTNSPMYEGGVMIPPGEGVLIEVPGEEPLQAQTAPLTISDAIAVMLKKPVAEVIKDLAGLSTDGLEMMKVLEDQGAKRVTIVRAVDAELFARANAALNDQHAKDRADQLDQATAALNAATAALDVEADTDKHPALEAAVAEARARVDALSDPDQT